MKNIFTYLAVAAMTLFVSCSSDSIIADGENVILEEGTMASRPALESGDETRGTLYLENAMMRFDWNEGDKIAVYPLYKPGTGQDIKAISESKVQVLTYLQNVNGGSGLSKAEFSPNGEKFVLNVKNTKDFVAWAPCLGEDFKDRRVPEFGYTAMPVTYENQIQSANVEMGHYVPTKSDEMALLLASEKRASAHLGNYDYLYAQAEQAGTGYTCFTFSHVQATVRFYMQIPESENPQVFDSLVIYHKFEAPGREGVNFVEKGKFSLETQRMTVGKKTNKLKLKLGTETEGLNLIDKEEGSSTKGEYNPIYGRNGKFYLIAYMQMYPVNITMDAMQEPTLYLYGHTGTEAEGNLKHTYYKARLAKKNIEAGKWYQWATTLDEEQPIQFEVVNVEEWKADDTFYNTVNKQEGQGTQDW